MEEVVAVAVDCPPTPEILPLTSTPPPPSQLQVVYSSSSEEADESADGRSSPPPKCAICLGKCRQKAYANSCRHQFCFRCLLEWSKVKPECPLCKQRFNSIVHYKSINCYEEHMIQTSNPLEQSLPREADFYRRLNFYVSDLPRITYHATLHMPTSQSELMQQLFMHQSSDVRRFIREFGDQVVPTRQNSIAWRQFIYRQRLYARPLPDVNGRFRVSSAHFYLMHPAQLHRILPWVEREVYAMETIAPTMSPPMATRMGYLLNSFDIDSPDFLRALAPFVCSSFREHFRHELFNFARSPYDMIGYDQCVQYEPRFNHRPNQHVILSSSDEELDSEQVDDGVVNMSEPVASTSSSSSSNSTGTVQGSTSGTGGRGRTGRTQFRFEARSTNETVIMTGTLRETRAEVEAFHAAASTPVIELNDNSDSPGSGSVPVAAAPTTSTLRDGDNISLSSSDSDDCQFVLAQKPPHLRTPDHVVDLESDYDSDVVFVAVESAGNQPAATNGDASEKHSLPLPKSDLSCEYNNGASTSSGYHGGAGSSGSGTSIRDNHYTRSRVNRYTGGMGVKSIYEESDSDEDDDDNEDGELYTASPRSPASGSSVCSSNSSSCPNTVCTVTSHDKVVYNLRTSVTTVTRGRKRKRNSRKTKQSGTKKVWRTRQRSTSSSSSSSTSSSDGDGSSSRKNVSTGSSNSSDSTRSSSATSSSSSSTSITSITSASASSASSESHSVEPSVVVKTSGDGHRIRLSTNWVTSKNKKNGKKDSKAEAASRAKPKTTRRGNAKKKGAQSKAARPPKAAPKKASAAKSNTEQPSGRSKRGKLSQKRPEEQCASPAVPMETGSSQEKGVKKIGQYFVQIQPSSSPTTEIATDDETTTAGGGGGRKRKLSRVIIKRYHQDDQPGPEMHPPGPQKKETSAPPGPECSSAKRTKSEDPVASCAPNGTTVEPTPGCSRNTVIAKTEVIDAPSASGSDSDSDATAVGNWQDTASGTAASVIVSTSQLAQPTVSDSAAELQLPLLPDHEQLLEDANSVALDTLLRFSPTLHWASADPPPIEDHLSISVSDTLSPETFSTITFSPSSTSVSPLAAMLAIPSSSVPELLEGIGSLTSASQLPSSVVAAATIDGAIDELISIIPADAFNNTQASLTGDGPAGANEVTESSSAALSSCAPLPPGHEPTNLPGVQSIVAGSEVEL